MQQYSSFESRKIEQRITKSIKTNTMIQITFENKQLTDIGESAPMLTSRKKEAASIEATVNIIGFAFFDDEVFIGGSADQTLQLENYTCYR